MPRRRENVDTYMELRIESTGPLQLLLNRVRQYLCGTRPEAGV
jgi:hypothetical protein